MIKISAIIIAKNEEDKIADCIDSLSFCSEILVINNASVDRTAEIAKRMGAKVFENDTVDFSKLRNFGLEKASMSWVFYVDADERVSVDLRKNIGNILDLTFSGYSVFRKNFYLGENAWPRIEKMQRLFFKEKLKGWKGALHESPILEGNIGQMEGYLFHYTHRNLSQMLKKTIEWSKIEANLRYESNHPKMTWWRFPRVMATSFFDYYFIQGGYKIGTAGLIESIYQSFSTFITYARLWEMQNKK